MTLIMIIVTIVVIFIIAIIVIIIIIIIDVNILLPSLSYRILLIWAFRKLGGGVPCWGPYHKGTLLFGSLY